MPKKIPITDKRRWLELSEQGKSESTIAKDAHRDVKTIKRGINEARMERVGAAARSELVRTALRNHHDGLLATVDGVLSALVLPTYNLEIRRQRDGSLAPIPLPGALVKYSSTEGLVLKLQVEDSPQWELLQEHLKRDRVWTSLNQWKLAMIKHIQARTDLKRKVRFLLEDLTGLSVFKAGDSAQEAEYLYDSTVELFYEVAIKWALAIPDGTNLEKRIVASDPYVRHGEGGTPLAYCPGKTEPCQGNIISACKQLQETPEVKQVPATYYAIREPIAKAKRALEEVHLLGLVPGHCRVCRRLGM